MQGLRGLSSASSRPTPGPRREDPPPGRARRSAAACCARGWPGGRRADSPPPPQWAPPSRAPSGCGRTQERTRSEPTDTVSNDVNGYVFVLTPKE